ncbi:hypothetical protein KUCAC02_025911, partial [Chaenocephalus aceratus]
TQFWIELFGALGERHLFSALGERQLFSALGERQLFSALGERHLFSALGERQLFSDRRERHLFSDRRERHLFSDRRERHLFSDLGERHLFSDLGERHLFSDRRERHLFSALGERHLFSDRRERHLFSDLGERHLFSDRRERHLFSDLGERHLFSDLGERHLFSDLGERHLFSALGERQLFSDLGERHLFSDRRERHLFSDLGERHLFSDRRERHLFSDLGERHLFSDRRERHLFSDRRERHLFSDRRERHLFSALGERHLFSDRRERHLFSDLGERHLFSDRRERHLFSALGERHLFSDLGERHLFSDLGERHLFSDLLNSQTLSPSSALHELYPIIIAAILWGHEWSRKAILIHTDNSAVVEILNKGRSRSLAIMQFLRRLTLISAQHQFILKAAHIPGHENGIADSVSFPIPEIQKLGPRGGSPFHTSPTVFSHHIQLNPQLELLSHASREAILNSLAPSTLSAYLTGWNCFKAYHGAYQLPFPTLDVISVCNFITHTHSIRKCRTSTIQTYLAGINFFIKIASGQPCPSTSHSHVTMLIKGLRKQEPSLTAKRLPLTSDLLSLCIRSLRSGYVSPMVDLTLECMFLLAFFGFLRCSEFAPTSSAYNPHHHPSLSDISLHTNDSLVFTLRRSKTDQLGISFPIHIFRLNSYLSPYEPLTKYLSARRAHAQLGSI